MELHLLILDGKRQKSGYTKPLKLIFKGNYALESCILKLIEVYFGPILKNKIEDMLRTRITETEIPEELFGDE